MDDSHLERAVAPNLFDALLDPELIFALVLANMMSPRLWDLRAHVLQSPDAGQPQAAGLIPRLQHQIDHHFEHVLPSQVADMNGVLDLDAEAVRLGSDAVEYALAQIQAAFTWRIERGTFPKDGFAFDLVAERKFPAYVYATIDEAHANRRFLKGRKHKPLGLTCCLDEAAIFTALNLILPEGIVDDIALIGSPAHYSVLTWTTDGGWWFYSKHELHTCSTWASLVASVYGGDAQMAFDDRLPRFDRIITVSGSYMFATGDASLSEPRLAAVIAKIEAFLGFRPAQLDHALARLPRFADASDLAPTLGEISTASSAEAVQAVVHRAAVDEGRRSAVSALFAFRSLGAPDLTGYLRAARRSTRIRDAFAPIDSVDDALRCVSSIAGSDSLFEDANRIAMPDETLRFATGTDRDKALLLHVLLERHPPPDTAAPVRLETLFTDAGSYVRSERFCISTSQMTPVGEAEGTILYRIADWSASDGAHDG